MKNQIFRRPTILLVAGAVVGAGALAVLQFASNLGGESNSGNDTDVSESRNLANGLGTQTVPPAVGGIGQQANVVNMVSQHDLARALSMLDQVRDGSTRFNAYPFVRTAFVMGR